VVDSRPPERRSALLRDLLWCGLAALGLRLALWEGADPPDAQRFLAQAMDLAAGRGFLCEGQPCTTLPPGYPVFVAVLMRLGLPAHALAGVNVALGSAVSVLLYLSLRTEGRGAARAAALAWGLNPWLARQAGLAMSEQLSALLCSLALLSLGPLLVAEPPSRRAAALAGGLLGALALTAPGTVFLCLGIALAVAWSARRQPGTVGALLLTASLVMAPWQLHVLSVTGRLAPAVVTLGPLERGPGLWVRSWRVTEDDLRFAWHPETLAAAPARAFSSPEERTALVRLARQARSPEDRALGEALERIAKRRLAEAGPEQAALVVLRSLLLWLEMPSISHIQASWVGRPSLASWRHDRARVGNRRAGLRVLKGLAATAAQLLYLLWPLGYGWLAVRAVRRRSPLGLGVLAGAVLYTLASGWTGLGEVRRNAPLVPALLALAAARPRRDAPGSRAAPVAAVDPG